ncbi:hypothetical protein CDAR_515751 [Caerostris darwini]|uniref:Uncharacterized protein n=1 Tax=Caerostris darwini TaxID=1538125 RepID=A0AAV4S2G8_9ARAC|nr:hypothetical protein CDAR_515751 [Caerostris darwini]
MCAPENPRFQGRLETGSLAGEHRPRSLLCGADKMAVAVRCLSMDIFLTLFCFSLRPPFPPSTLLNKEKERERAYFGLQSLSNVLNLKIGLS